jgi:hypothetical protein
MNIVTVSDLRAMGACEEGIRWMREAYPDGAQVTAETLATVPDKRWLVWLASKRHPDLLAAWAELAIRHEIRRHSALAKHASKVTAKSFWQTNEEADDAYERHIASRAAEIAGYAADSAGYAAFLDAYADGDDAARAAEVEAAEAAWSEMADISARYLLME